MRSSGDRALEQSGIESLLARLLVEARGAAPDQLPGLAAWAASQLGADGFELYLLDYGQEQLAPFVPAGSPRRETVPIAGTVAGRAFALMRPQHSTSGGHQLWLPLTDGAERLGVCRASLPAAPTPAQVEALSALTTQLGALVITRDRYGDIFQQLRRGEPMQLAAEIVWSMLPPLAFANRDVSIAAVLEPCYDIGGDVFDYAVNSHTVQLALFDVVGHGIAATALTALALNAYRNARRTGLDLPDTYRSIDRWVSAQSSDQFVTAIICELDIQSGVLHYISAAHPAALLFRDGVHIGELDTPTAAPCGYNDYLGRPPRVARHQLQPGDHLLLYTDGVVEVRSPQGMFGIPRLADFTVKAIADGLSTAETLRRLRRALLDHHQDRLQDDATAILLRWHPPVPSARPAMN